MAPARLANIAQLPAAPMMPNKTAAEHRILSFLSRALQSSRCRPKPVSILTAKQSSGSSCNYLSFFASSSLLSRLTYLTCHWSLIQAILLCPHPIRLPYNQTNLSLEFSAARQSCHQIYRPLFTSFPDYRVSLISVALFCTFSLYLERLLDDLINIEDHNTPKDHSEDILLSKSSFPFLWLTRSHRAGSHATCKSYHITSHHINTIDLLRRTTD
ncbi:hypothetical protein F5Y15DRAFT_195713 [Xylariaceae sp. FL0016]|nr:hypothetical protein F5Y15DRAFT_195713 [Xylariaceae sp. FL0016]